MRLGGGDPSVYRTDHYPHCATDTSHPSEKTPSKASEGLQKKSAGERIEGAERLLALMTSFAKDYSNADL